MLLIVGHHKVVVLLLAAIFSGIPRNLQTHIRIHVAMHTYHEVRPRHHKVLVPIVVVVCCKRLTVLLPRVEVVVPQIQVGACHHHGVRTVTIMVWVVLVCHAIIGRRLLLSLLSLKRHEPFPLWAGISWGRSRNSGGRSAESEWHWYWFLHGHGRVGGVLRLRPEPLRRVRSGHVGFMSNMVLWECSYACGGIFRVELILV